MVPKFWVYNTQGSLVYPVDFIRQVDMERGMPYRTAVLKDGTDKKRVNLQQVRGGYSSLSKDMQYLYQFLTY